MSDLRVGILGFGLAGRGFHGAFLRAVEGMAITSIATSRSVDAAKFPGTKVVATAEEVIADPRIDLVVVATPNRLHVPQSLAALAAGKHVVVEKPVARTCAEVRSVIDAARRAERLWIPFQNRRFDGDFRTVRRLLREGTLGTVHAYSSSWPAYRPSVAQRSAWKAEADPNHGLLYDLGPHLIDQAIVLFGKPLRVFAQIQTRRPGGKVVDLFRIVLSYDGGLTATLHVDQLDPFDPPRFEVRGSAGAFQKHGVDAQEAAIRAGELPGDAPWGVEPPERYGRLITPDSERRVPTEFGDYRDFYRAVRAAIQEGAEPPVRAEDALLQLAIIDAALASSESGRAEEVCT